MWLEGCTHFIIGRDMAGSKSSVTGEDFYGAYDAQETAAKHAEELHMQTVPSLNITYTEVRHPFKFLVTCLFRSKGPGWVKEQPCRVLSDSHACNNGSDYHIVG